MSTRHPAGRGCWGGATAILAIAGVLTASLLGILHMVTSGDPAVPANAPAAVVQTLAPTTTPAVTTTPAATTTAPAAVPHALAAATEESPVVTSTPSPTGPDPQYIDLGSGVTQRVAPPNPTGQPPAPLGPENGWDPTGGPNGGGAPVGPDPATDPQR